MLQEVEHIASSAKGLAHSHCCKRLSIYLVMQVVEHIATAAKVEHIATAAKVEHIATAARC